MPRIRRWFHVSHDINSDPEVWEMRDRFGDRALGVWLEILSIADRHAGLVPGDIRYLSSALAGKCKTKRYTVECILEYATDKEWIVYDPVRRVRNHLKYRPTRDAKHIPTREIFNIPSSPTHSSPIHKEQIHTPERGNGFDAFWKTYPRKKSKGQAEKAWTAIKPDEQLQDRIRDAVERAMTSDEWQKDGGKFIPYPATWLRAKGWEDEIPAWEEDPNP